MAHPKQFCALTKLIMATEDDQRVERLIELVRESTVLYNVADPDYKDVALIENKWRSIAARCNYTSGTERGFVIVFVCGRWGLGGGSYYLVQIYILRRKLYILMYNIEY